MNKIINFLKAWLGATGLTYFLASTFHSQVVLAGLTAIGVDIPFSERLSMTAWDWWGLLPKYGAAIAAGMLLAMVVVLIVHRLGGALIITAIIGGGTAMLTIILVMHPIMDVTLIAGARGPIGIVSQCFAGLVGGAMFGLLYTRTNKHKDVQHE